MRELALLATGSRVIVCLGAFAWDAALRLRAWRAGRRRARARSRASATAPSSTTAVPLLGCFHPSQQNTFTGELTPPMLDDVLLRARALAGLGRLAA